MLQKGALRLDSLLFGESAGRIVVSVAPDGEEALRTLCATHRVPLAKIGVTGGKRVTVSVDGAPLLDADAGELAAIHGGSLEKALNS